MESVMIKLVLLILPAEPCSTKEFAEMTTAMKTMEMRLL